MKIITPIPEMVEEVNELMKETWLATYPNEGAGISREDIKDFVSTWDDSTSIQQRKEFYAELPQKLEQFVRVAMVGEKIAGLCWGIREVEQVRLRSLYVHPIFQKQGIGSALMGAFLGWAGTSLPVVLSVTDYNEPAIRFYERYPFIDTGKRFSEERFRLKSGAIFTEMEMVRK